MIQNKLYNTTKYKSQLAKHSKCSAQFNHGIIVIAIPSGCDMLTVTILGVISWQEVIHGLKPAQASCSLRNSFTSCFVFSTLYWAESQVRSPSFLAWLTQGNIYIFKECREKHLHHQLSSSAVGSGLPETKVTLWSFVLRLGQFLCTVPWASWTHQLDPFLLRCLSLQVFVGQSQSGVIRSPNRIKNFKCRDVIWLSLVIKYEFVYSANVVF